MNIFIFYDVLGHIDFFQNNILFENTWNDDFVGQALADKRLLESLRSEYGRWVDYAIEFSRSIDNITGYFYKISEKNFPDSLQASGKMNYYFNIFLQENLKLPQHEIFKEVFKYNDYITNDLDNGESVFLGEVITKHPEFEAKFEKFEKELKEEPSDIMEYIRDNSPFLKQEKNEWMKSVMTIIRNTSLYFAPQIRSKIINEGWASYWHDELFRRDDRIKGHEIGYAKLNAGVTSISRIGLNPYAIGMRLIQYVEELADKGKLFYNFQKSENMEYRENYNRKTGTGKEAIFELRKNFSDFMLINTFCTQDFVDEHDLFVVGKRYNEETNLIEYYIKSRKAEDYKQMLLDSLYHPPVISVVQDKTNEKNLYLTHKFEGKQLIKDFIPDVLMGIEFMWGGQVQLETTEIMLSPTQAPDEEPDYDYRRILYTMKDKKVSRTSL
jgi:stage V sporulation protein R